MGKGRKAWVAVSACRSRDDLGQLGTEHGANPCSTLEDKQAQEQSDGICMLKRD